MVLSVAMCISTCSCWTATDLQIVPIRDTNRHTEVTMLAMYILLHMVQFAPVLKYTLRL